MFIVQVGTNDGNDHVLKFCKEHQVDISGVVLVEPFPIHNNAIQKHYAGFKNVKLFNVAIVPDEQVKSVQMYYAMADGPTTKYPQRKFEVTSMLPEHLYKHGYVAKELQSFFVQSMTMNQLLKTTGYTVIDYLFLDIEGIDREVLETIDFATFDIRRLQIEKIHLDLEWLQQFMKDRGYVEEPSLDVYNYDIMFRKL